MGDDSEEAEVSGCCSEVGGGGYEARGAVAVYVFYCADVVVYGFVLTTCAVADGAVNSAECYSGDWLASCSSCVQKI